MEDFAGRCPARDFAWPVVDLGDEFVELGLGEIGESGAHGKVAAFAAVEVFVRAALPERIWLIPCPRTGNTITLAFDMHDHHDQMGGNDVPTHL